MTPISMQITYVPSKVLGASYWVRLEKGKAVAETVTISEVASVLDEYYDIDACTGDSGTGGEAAEPIVPTTENAAAVDAKLIDAFQTGLTYDPCKFIPGTLDYYAEVQVFRSHVGIPYKLVLTNGDIRTTVIVTKQITNTVLVEGDTITLEFPIVGNLMSDAPVLDFNGGNVLLSEKVQGLFTFVYSTQYERVLIRVKGDDDNREELSCNCIAFYNLLVTELQIDPPTEEGVAISQMGCQVEDTQTEDAEEDEEDGDSPDACYQRWIHTVLCSCSLTTKDTYDEIKQIECGSTNYDRTTVGGALQDNWTSKDVTHYTRCPDEEDWEGQDDEFYEDNCCAPPPSDMVLPTCYSRLSNYYGGHEIDRVGDGIYLDATLVPVGPEDGICGVLTVQQIVESKNCCDSEFYTDLDYDDEDSAEVLSPSSSGLVFWDGGDSSSATAGQATVTVHGSGFWLNALFTKKSGIGVGSARIYTDENVCGACSITIEDNCSSTTGSVLATEGGWVLYSTDLALCTAGGEWAVVGIREVTRQTANEKMYMRYNTDGLFHGDCWSDEGKANANAVCADFAVGKTVCGYNNLTIKCSQLFGSWNCYVANSKAHYKWGC